MMRRIALGVLLVVALAAVAIWWRARPAPPTAYVGGPILTMDATDRVVGGLAVESGRIVRVGGVRLVQVVQGAVDLPELVKDAGQPQRRQVRRAVQAQGRLERSPGVGEPALPQISRPEPDR